MAPELTRIIRVVCCQKSWTVSRFATQICPRRLVDRGTESPAAMRSCGVIHLLRGSLWLLRLCARWAFFRIPHHIATTSLAPLRATLPPCNRTNISLVFAIGSPFSTIANAEKCGKTASLEESKKSGIPIVMVRVMVSVGIRVRGVISEETGPTASGKNKSSGVQNYDAVLCARGLPTHYTCYQ